MPDILTCGQSLLIMIIFLIILLTISFVVAMLVYIIFKKRYWLFWVLFLPLSNSIFYFGANIEICFKKNMEIFIVYTWFFIDAIFLIIIWSHFKKIKSQKND